MAVAGSPHDTVNFTAPLTATDAGGGTVDIALAAPITVADETETTNTSNVTNVTKLTLNTGAVAAGNYRLGYCYSWRRTNANNDCILEILEDGVVIRTHQSEPKDTGGDQAYPAAGFIHRTLTAATHTYVMRFRGSTNGPTTGISQSVMEFWQTS